MHQKLVPAAIVVVVVASTAVFLAVIWFALTSWPSALIEGSGVATDALSPEDHLSALNDVRSSLMSAIGGLSAVALAVGALWQANSARVSFQRQKAVEWSTTFAHASEQLGSSSATVRLAGAVALSAIADSGPDNASTLVRALFASHLRARTVSDPSDASAQLALHALCNAADRTPQSLTEAILSDLNLSGLNFDGIDLTGVSFRNAILDESQRTYVERAQRADTHGVRWQSY